MLIRLQKIMANAGIASRRKCEEFIRAGRVKVNNQIITELGFKADPEKDRIEFDGKPVIISGKNTYLALNKPTGYITSFNDPENRPTVVKLLSGLETRVFPVGRLDYNSEGLLILTDDGQLAQRLTHPKYKVEKEYMVWCQGKINHDAVKELSRGIRLEDGLTQPAQIKIIDRMFNESLLSIIIKEGRKRQIRRMLEQVGYPVKRLVRVRIGPVQLGRLKPGHWRKLKPQETSILFKNVGL